MLSFANLSMSQKKNEKKLESLFLMFKLTHCPRPKLNADNVQVLHLPSNYTESFLRKNEIHCDMQ